MPVWLTPFDFTFPDPALEADSEGLLAIGGELSAERLISAYRQGIFPWFAHFGDPYWFCPDPRCVLLPKDLVISKSMRPVFNQKKFTFTLDTAFQKVMENCRDVWRRGELQSSWIDENFIGGYQKLHEMGLAHSVEVWQDGELVGGLYGVALGRVFSGESMFSLVPNASKAGFIKLVQTLRERGFWLVDCQVHTPHLESLGAREIPRRTFLDILKKNTHEPTEAKPWSDWLTANG